MLGFLGVSHALGKNRKCESVRLLRGIICVRKNRDLRGDT